MTFIMPKPIWQYVGEATDVPIVPISKPKVSNGHMPLLPLTCPGASKRPFSIARKVATPSLERLLPCPADKNERKV